MSNESSTKFFSKPTIIAITTGLFASALWEKVFSPILDATYLIFLDIAKVFSDTIATSTYRQISLGFRESYSFTSQIVFITTIIYLLWFLILNFLSLRSKLLKKESGNQKSKVKKIPKAWPITTVSLILTLLTIYVVSREVYIHNCISRTTANIEIIAPYISDYDCKMLNSRFRSLSSEEDYYSLTQDIKDIANQNDLFLHE